MRHHVGEPGSDGSEDTVRTGHAGRAFAARPPDNATLLRLYALYKQGAEGDARGPGPAVFDFVATAKHEAWSKLAGMRQEEAIRQYIDLVVKLRG